MNYSVFSPPHRPPLPLLHFISGRMMGFEPMTKGATILYSTIWATISIFVGQERLALPEALTTAFTELPATNYGLLTHYFVWMARLERALAITACSGSQNRRGLPTPPHPDYKFSKLVNDLKNKKSFVITEEALYKLYYIVTLITFLKIYFITIPISKRHAIKWTSTKGWTNNRTNMWINLTHVFYDIFKFINNNNQKF